MNYLITIRAKRVELYRAKWRHEVIREYVREQFVCIGVRIRIVKAMLTELSEIR